MAAGDTLLQKACGKHQQNPAPGVSQRWQGSIITSDLPLTTLSMLHSWCLSATSSMFQRRVIHISWHHGHDWLVTPKNPWELYQMHHVVFTFTQQKLNHKFLPFVLKNIEIFFFISVFFAKILTCLCIIVLLYLLMLSYVYLLPSCSCCELFCYYIVFILLLISVGEKLSKLYCISLIRFLILVQ